MALILPAFCGAAQEQRPGDEGVIRRTYTFAELGAGRIELGGRRRTGIVDIASRLDEVVVAAKVHLRMTYSPSLLQDLSHLRVSINDQTIAAVPLPREQSGRQIEREVILDPLYFSDYNHIRFDFIGHYTLECEDPSHSSLWLVINPDSHVELTLRPLELRGDLALLPAPFFDARDNRKLILPMVLPPNPSLGVVRAAGVTASWFGSMADYRGARFPVSLDALPDRHAVVLATNAQRPAQLQLPLVQAPTISIVSHPANPFVKLLVLQGRDDEQLRLAVEGMVLGEPVMSGTQAQVDKVVAPARKPYDVPRWLRSDRPVTFGELTYAPQQLQVDGANEPPIRINMRMPPDLFIWNRTGIPVDLRYRYSAPVKRDNSLLSVSFNDGFLRSYRLPPEDSNDAIVQERDDFMIPRFQIHANNQMQFQFTVEQHREGQCADFLPDSIHAAIDPDSTIDISRFAHYVALPDLALFVSAGYPFTRYADLGETAIVVPGATDAASLEEFLFVIGRMGRHTGAAALRVQMISWDDLPKVRDKDVLLVGAYGKTAEPRFSKEYALLFREAGRRLKALDPAPAFSDTPARSADPAFGPKGEVDMTVAGSLGAFIANESPFAPGRTLLVMVGTDVDASKSLVDALDDDSRSHAIRGELAIVHAGGVRSYRGDDVYYNGSLPWWMWLWFHFSRHAVLLTVVTLVVSVVIAAWIHGWLQRRAQRRLDTAESS